MPSIGAPALRRDNREGDTVVMLDGRPARTADATTAFPQGRLAPDRERTDPIPLLDASNGWILPVAPRGPGGRGSRRASMARVSRLIFSPR